MSFERLIIDRNNAQHLKSICYKVSNYRKSEILKNLFYKYWIKSDRSSEETKKIKPEAHVWTVSFLLAY